jgi:hypothetical protein
MVALNVSLDTSFLGSGIHFTCRSCFFPSLGIAVLVCVVFWAVSHPLLMSVSRSDSHLDKTRV